MSSAARHSHSLASSPLKMSAPIEVPSVRPAPRLKLRWSISPLAARNAGLAHAHDEASLLLEIDVHEDRPIEARLVRAGDSTPVPIEHASAPRIVRDEAGLFHIDIPGVLSATWSEQSHGGSAGPFIRQRTLYARTSVLASLGLGGGRYELECGD